MTPPAIAPAEVRVPEDEGAVAAELVREVDHISSTPPASSSVKPIVDSDSSHSKATAWKRQTSNPNNPSEHLKCSTVNISELISSARAVSQRFGDVQPLPLATGTSPLTRLLGTPPPPPGTNHHLSANTEISQKHSWASTINSNERSTLGSLRMAWPQPSTEDRRPVLEKEDHAPEASRSNPAITRPPLIPCCRIHELSEVSFGDLPNGDLRLARQTTGVLKMRSVWRRRPRSGACMQGMAMRSGTGITQDVVVVFETPDEAHSCDADYLTIMAKMPFIGALTHPSSFCTGGCRGEAQYPEWSWNLHRLCIPLYGNDTEGLEWPRFSFLHCASKPNKANAPHFHYLTPVSRHSTGSFPPAYPNPSSTLSLFSSTVELVSPFPLSEDTAWTAYKGGTLIRKGQTAIRMTPRHPNYITVVQKVRAAPEASSSATDVHYTSPTRSASIVYHFNVSHNAKFNM
ncbi:hypothetical protein BKA70DRAFT_1448421 [Coprinopsis sp. MPI-PUGE-AT-0042]|nr:hypothetical protein BKA70DRAFT_1448421 [Coprinopsis sp. MPI-PUGE-AT-0042]